MYKDFQVKIATTHSHAEHLSKSQPQSCSQTLLVPTEHQHHLSRQGAAAGVGWGVSARPPSVHLNHWNTGGEGKKNVPYEDSECVRFVICTAKVRLRFIHWNAKKFVIQKSECKALTRTVVNRTTEGGTLGNTECKLSLSRCTLYQRLHNFSNLSFKQIRWKVIRVGHIVFHVMNTHSAAEGPPLVSFWVSCGICFHFCSFKALVTTYEGQKTLCSLTWRNGPLLALAGWLSTIMVFIINLLWYKYFLTLAQAVLRLILRTDVLPFYFLFIGTVLGL